MNDNPRVSRDARPFAAAAVFLRGRENTLCLTPHDGAAAALRAALAAGDGCGLSPQIIALPRLLVAAGKAIRAEDLAVAARLSSAAPSAARRELAMQIYACLREHSPPSSAAELLSRAAALAEFFEEFMDSRPSLRVSRDELPRLCEAMTRDNSAVRAEADAVSLLWEMLHRRLHSARGALADFARIAPPMLYVGEEPRSPWLDDFLRQCAHGATIFAPEEDAAPAAEELVKNGAAAWHPQIAHISRCREGCAASLHQAAHLALSAVRDFAADGTVGVVVYDRLLARRLRAVAESCGVRMEDDGGWRMETLSFGGALRQWTETVCAFAPGQFGKILSAPFWKGNPRRGAAAFAWRRLLAGDGPLPLSLRDFGRFGDTAFAPFAETLAAAERARPRTGSPRLWTKWLLAHSAMPLAAWKNDPVAAELRAELAAAADGEELNAAEFRAFLNMFMRGETGGDRDIASRACFAPPTTSRRFDSVVLLGAREGSLPPPPDSFWGENGRRALQLPGRGETVARQLAQFARLTAAHANIAAVWHSAADGRAAAASPFWTLLTDAMKDAGKTMETIAPIVDESIAIGLLPPPRAAGRMRKLPRKIFVTAAARLTECPYRFFAEHILELGEEDGDEILPPAGRGILLHRAMKQFAEKAGDETHPDKLLALWRETFSALPAARPGAKMAIQHWLLRGELFVRNEAARRAAGWLPRMLEYKVAATLPLSGGEVPLRGRIDRVDRNENGDWAFTDYKSGGGPNKKAMQTGEDPQLPLYAFLCGETHALWRVCYPADDDKTIETAGDSRRIAARLRAAARRISAGAPMYARKSAACKDCPSRRLCRRDHWRTADGETAA
ncbi:MAG: PD-(D/E)XK nuclease family protein [Gammaproteobacteria bacterium]